ncbi:oligosaccharide flippase family protein [Antarcticibacterium sp. 1MA-6-2]|uniref:lipopolysaccharide biosynthesis protein n=1 Tax=Antarcticibacterium sp. 1MA-6-2 TaxID=2908210 RepID=UPI001F2734EF|nr:oligosaccharide flippase family protein [Antarcticibacterium sp. 1MA-6-2]UJH89866.1 oligosaccharide flippase family protein [Antarcticibacterium sp. 1MA-6-2]
MWLKDNFYGVLKKGKKNSFIKGFSFLLGGTVITQIITLVLAPVLTRLYSPEEYGINALYISTISMLGVFATLRFNSAIVIAENIFERNRLIRLCIITTISISVISLITIGGIQFSGHYRNFGWLWFVPLSVLLMGFFEILYASILNQNKYKVLAKITIVKITIQGVAQILFSFFGFGYAGLILGNILSFVVVLFILLNFHHLIFVWKNIVDFHRYWQTFKTFLEYPKFAFPAELASMASLMLFPFLISYLYTVEEVGFFALANKLIGIPIGLFGNSVRQVFVREVSPYAKNFNMLRKKYTQTSLVLFFLGLASSGVLYILGPSFFSFVFGKEWVMAGIYVQALILLLLARMTITPLLSILIVIKKQRMSLIINFSLVFAMVLCTTVYKIFFSAQIQSFLFAISLVLSLIYFSSFFLILKILKNKNDED